METQIGSQPQPLAGQSSGLRIFAEHGGRRQWFQYPDGRCRVGLALVPLHQSSVVDQSRAMCNVRCVTKCAKRISDSLVTRRSEALPRKPRGAYGIPSCEDTPCCHR